MERILAAANEVRAISDQPEKPLLIKLAPDMSDEQLQDMVHVAQANQVAGIVVTNTTIERQGLSSPLAAETGGLSGKPLTQRSLAVLQSVRHMTDLPLIAAGGIMTGADAVNRMLAGADLLQVYSGFIYTGPSLIREILSSLLGEIEQRGLSSVSQLRGA